MTIKRLRQKSTLIRCLCCCAALALFGSNGCYRRADQRVVGTWNWKGCDDGGTVVYKPDHTFVSNEWALTYSQQPPVIIDGGDWAVHGEYLALKFKGNSRPENARDVKLRFSMFDGETMIIRGYDGNVLVFTRLK